MDVKVDVVDVNGTALPSCPCSLLYVEETSPNHFNQLIKNFPSGQVVSVNVTPQVPRMQLVIDPPDYTRESIIVDQPKGGNWQTDNPCCTVMATANSLAFQVTLGCLCYAPAVEVPGQ